MDSRSEDFVHKSSHPAARGVIDAERHPQRGTACGNPVGDFSDRVEGIRNGGSKKERHGDIGPDLGRGGRSATRVQRAHQTTPGRRVLRNTRRVLVKSIVSSARVAEERIGGDVPVQAVLIRDASGPVPSCVAEDVRAGNRRRRSIVAVHGLPIGGMGDDATLQSNGRLGVVRIDARPGGSGIGGQGRAPDRGASILGRQPPAVVGLVAGETASDEDRLSVLAVDCAPGVVRPYQAGRQTAGQRESLDHRCAVHPDTGQDSSQPVGVDDHVARRGGFASKENPGLHLDSVFEVGARRDQNAVAGPGGIDARLDRGRVRGNVPGAVAEEPLSERADLAAAGRVQTRRGDLKVVVAACRVLEQGIGGEVAVDGPGVRHASHPVSARVAVEIAAAERRRSRAVTSDRLTLGTGGEDGTLDDREGAPGMNASAGGRRVTDQGARLEARTRAAGTEDGAAHLVGRVAVEDASGERGGGSIAVDGGSLERPPARNREVLQNRARALARLKRERTALFLAIDDNGIRAPAPGANREGFSKKVHVAISGADVGPARELYGVVPRNTVYGRLDRGEVAAPVRPDRVDARGTADAESPDECPHGGVLRGTRRILLQVVVSLHCRDAPAIRGIAEARRNMLVVPGPVGGPGSGDSVGIHIAAAEVNHRIPQQEEIVSGCVGAVIPEDRGFDPEGDPAIVLHATPGGSCTVSADGAAVDMGFRAVGGLEQDAAARGRAEVVDYGAVFDDGPRPAREPTAAGAPARRERRVCGEGRSRKGRPNGRSRSDAPARELGRIMRHRTVRDLGVGAVGKAQTSPRASACVVRDRAVDDGDGGGIAENGSTVAVRVIVDDLAVLDYGPDSGAVDGAPPVVRRSARDVPMRECDPANARCQSFARVEEECPTQAFAVDDAEIGIPTQRADADLLAEKVEIPVTRTGVRSVLQLDRDTGRDRIDGRLDGGIVAQAVCPHPNRTVTRGNPPYHAFVTRIGRPVELVQCIPGVL